METSILSVKKISISVLLLIFIYPSILLGQGTSCFEDEAIIQKDKLKIGTCACSPVTLEYPKLVAYSMKYPVRGQWGQCGAYSNMTSMVKAGWVDDESLESETFWQTSYFNLQFTDFIRTDGAFGVDVLIPDDEYAYKHKYLKLQISMIGIGNNGSFKLTTIYRIPISEIIQGEVKLIDVATNPQIKEFDIKPLTSSDNRPVYIKLIADGKLIDSVVTKDNGCYKVTVKPGHLNSSLVIHDDAKKDISDTISWDFFANNIDHPKEGGKVSSWDYLPILNKIRKAQVNLDNKDINLSEILDGGFIWEMLKSSMFWLNQYYGSNVNVDSVKIKLNKIPLYKPFNPKVMKELLNKYNAYNKYYDTIFRYKGDFNDSLRAQFLVRLLYGINSIDSLYNRHLQINGEISKILVNYIKVFIFAEEAEAVLKNTPDVVKREAISAIIDGLFSVASTVIDFIGNTWTITNPNYTIGNNSASVLSKSISAMKDMYLSKFDESLAGKPHSPERLSAATDLLKDDALEMLVMIIGAIYSMPQYIYNANYNYALICQNLGMDKGYYKATKYETLTNHYAYSNINNISDYSNSITEIFNEIENNVKTSKQIRNLNDFTDGVISISEGILTLLKSSISLGESELINRIKPIPLTLALYTDIQTLTHSNALGDWLPIATFFPQIQFNKVGSTADYRYFYYYGQPSKIIPATSNFIPKSKGSSLTDNIKLQLDKLDVNLVKLIDEAVDAGKVKDTTVMNEKFFSLLNKSDSLLIVNKQINNYFMSLNDSIYKNNTALYKDFLSVLTANYETYSNIIDFDLYLFIIKANKGVFDSLKLLADSAKAGLGYYSAITNKTFDSVASKAMKAFLTINDKSVSDSIKTGEVFTIKAKIFNPGTINVDSIKVVLTQDKLTKILSDSMVYISKLGPGEEKEISWQLRVDNPIKSSGHYLIEVMSPLTYYTNTGIFSVYIAPVTEFTIDGSLLYEDNSTGKALSNVKLILKTSEEEKKDSTTTDSKGYYKFSQVKPGAYFVEPEIKKQPGGINPIDALLINRNYLSMYKISNELMKKAADVNLDTKITPIDALMVNRRYLGIVKTFKAGNWIYEKDTVKIINDDIRYNIKAICPGDVNGNYSPPGK